MNPPFTPATFPLCAALAISTALICGCASYPPPREDLAAARVALDEARATAPDGFVAQEVALAQGKIALGERWMAAGDLRPARWLAEQARVDAELAAMKAAAARARMAAGERRR